MVFFLADAESLGKELSPKGSELVSLSENLVDAVWTDQPARPASLVFHLDEKYSGISHICISFALLALADSEIKDSRMWIKLQKCEKNWKRRRPRLLS